jgi:hypothetical protein
VARGSRAPLAVSAKTMRAREPRRALQQRLERRGWCHHRCGSRWGRSRELGARRRAQRLRPRAARLRAHRLCKQGEHGAKERVPTSRGQRLGPRAARASRASSLQPGRTRRERAGSFEGTGRAFDRTRMTTAAVRHANCPTWCTAAGLKAEVASSSSAMALTSTCAGESFHPGGHRHPGARVAGRAQRGGLADGSLRLPRASSDR